MSNKIEELTEELISTYKREINILNSIIESDEKIIAMQAEIIGKQNEQIQELKEGFEEILKSL